MELNRYMQVLRAIMMSSDEIGHETSTKTLIRLTMQYGAAIKIRPEEVLEVLEARPFERLIMRCHIEPDEPWPRPKVDPFAGTKAYEYSSDLD